MKNMKDMKSMKDMQDIKNIKDIKDINDMKKGYKILSKYKSIVVMALILVVLLSGCNRKLPISDQTTPTTRPIDITGSTTESDQPTSPDSTTSTANTDSIEASGSERFSITDSTGRTFDLPKNISKIAVSGPLAQIVVFALAPDKLVGLASEWDKSAEEYLPTEYCNLPILGQLYGGKGEMNLETLLSSGAQVVIDIGEPKDTIMEDLDSLTAQTGIPFVHISATTETMGDTYRKLGELLDMKEEAEVLAKYCETMYDRIKQIADRADKVGLLYCLGDAGLNVIAKGSYHAEIIDLLSDNLAVVESPSSKGSGNEVDMEQIMVWNPEVIIFAPDSIYDIVAEDELWKQLDAISTGRYYEVPFGPYNWMGFPSSVQRYLGMMWMAETLYPEAAQIDLYSEVATYFRLFYHVELTEEQYNERFVSNNN